MNNIYSFLGICMKAGKLVSGEFMVEKSIKEHSVKLTIIAEDASNNTKKKFINLCNYRNIPYIILGDKLKLANAIGKEMRTTIGICDSGFANKILSIYEQVNN